MADSKANLQEAFSGESQANRKYLFFSEKVDEAGNNQVALWLFMLSYYVADAHVPLHCDARQFSEGEKIHTRMEKAWDDEVRRYYRLDKPNFRFFYDVEGYPALVEGDKIVAAYQSSVLKAVDDELNKRKLDYDFGKGNKNVWDFMNAVCHHSYLLSYRFFPKEKKLAEITKQNWQTLASPVLSFDQLSVAVLSDAIDSISRVWFRTWRRYDKWAKKKGDKEDKGDKKVPDSDDDE